MIDFVLIGNEKICYHTFGSGEQTAVLFCGHAVPFPLGDMHALAMALADKMRVIIIDRFGYGYSDISERPCNFESNNIITKCVLDELGVIDRVCLIGHSLGTFYALSFAERYPQMIEKIVFLDSYPAIDNFQLMFNRVWGVIALIAKKVGLLKVIGIERMGDYLFGDEDIPNQIRDEGARIALKKYYNRNTWSELKGVSKRIRKLYKESEPISNMPILAICRNITLFQHRKLRKFFTNVRLINVGASSHFIHHDHEARVNSEVLAYLC